MFFLDFQGFNETQTKVNIELAKGWISIRNGGYNNRRHQNKLDRCINPDEPALHWKTKLKLGFAYVSETQPNINKISKKKRYHE